MLWHRIRGLWNAYHGILAVILTLVFWSYLTIIAAPAEGELSRLGIVASRKIGGAVSRNRAKRLIRQVFRTEIVPARASDLPSFLRRHCRWSTRGTPTDAS